MNSHYVQFIKHLTAVGTFPHPVSNTVINARPTKNVATCLKCGIFEVVAADGTSSKFL